MLSALRNTYKISVDFSGANYCGLKLNWNYSEKYVDISLPGYIANLLHKLQHKIKKSPQLSPHKWTTPTFGKKRQFAKEASNLPILPLKSIRYVQTVVGSLLYYSRAVDPTMLVALNEIAAVQSKPTQETIEKCQMLLDYAATYPNTVQRFYSSDMILHVDSDAAYLVQDNARSRIAGSYILSSHPAAYNQSSIRQHNSPFHVECKTLRHVVASSAEAETGALFYNGQNIVALRQALECLGHKQPPTPLKTDNSTACGYVNKNIRIKKSKSWDMRFHWLRDRQLRNFFKVFWQQGSNNDADYFTKHFSPAHHKMIRSRYVLNAIQNLPTIVRRTCEGVLRG